MKSLDFAHLESHWVDLAMLAWLLVSMLIGLARGLVFECLSLVGWGVAYFAAQWAAPVLAPHLRLGEPASPSPLAAFLCAFVLVLLVWGVATRLLCLLVRVTPLNWPDRVLGAGFGVVRGMLVLLVVAIAVGLTPLGDSLSWTQSQGATWLNAAWHGLKPLLPYELSHHLPA